MKKFLYIIFIILIFVVIGEVGYYLFFKSKLTAPATSVNINPPSQSNDISITPIKEIEPVEEQSLNLTGTLLIRKEAKMKDGIFTIDNLNNPNYMGYSTETPINLISPFKIKIKFSREGDGIDVQLTLSGKKGGEKLRTISQLTVKTTKEDVVFNIMDERFKESESWERFYHKDIVPGDSFYLVFFDQTGKTYSVVNNDGIVLDTIDVTKLDKVSLPNGLFPEKKMWPGVIVGGRIKLLIDEFVLTFTGK